MPRTAAQLPAITRKFNVLVEWRGRTEEFRLDVTTGDGEAAFDVACDLARKNCKVACGLPPSGIRRVTFLHVVN